MTHSPPPPPTPQQSKLGLTKLFLGMVVGISAVIYLGHLPSINADLKANESGNRPSRQSTGVAQPFLWLEYYGDEYISYLYEVSNYYTNVGTVQVGASPSRPGSIQICGVNPTCVDGTPDTNGNYFDGTKIHNAALIRGGELAAGDTDFWIVKHPTISRSSPTFYYNYTATNGDKISDGSLLASYVEIGFKSNNPTIEPQTGDNQYQITWSNPTRYTPNQQGLITNGSQAKGINDKITYWVQTADNEDLNTPQETEVSASNLTINGSNYQHTITHTYPDNTKIWTRIRYQESRSGNSYDIYSQPETYTPPALIVVPQTPTNLRATSTLNSITFTWDSITSQTPLTRTQYRYKFEEDPYLDAFFTQWNDTPSPTDTSITISNLRTSKGYSFELRATNEHGDSQTATIEASTRSPAPPPPPPPTPSGETPTEPTPSFTDTDGSVHEGNIVQLADMGVTRGCNPPENSRFCPDRAVSRGEMATFLVRAFELAPTNEDPFTDTQGNVHRPNINRMAAAGISRGCNPPTNTRFCPDRAVTRAEMATFMTRVLQLEEEGTGFTDTEGNVHATNIRKFAEAGITRGCNPPENSRYCPDRAVTRGEMATFLVRSTSLNNS